MTNPQITSALPEQARDVRARAWAFVFQCWQEKKGSRPAAPDDGTKVKEDSADVPSLPH